MIATERPPLTDAQKKRRAAEAKGKRLEQAIRAWLESQGWRVETAPKVVHWMFDKTLGRRVPRSSRRDFFEVWDGVAVRGSARVFYQVTVLGEMSKKRSRIIAGGFPVSRLDAIYGYVGRPCRWRLLRGPDFAMPGVSIVCSAPRLKGGSRADHRRTPRQLVHVPSALRGTSGGVQAPA